MPTGDPTSPPDPAHLHDALRHALRHGARAARLVTHTPHLVDLLAPPDTTDADREPTAALRRAYQAEQIIRAAIDEMGGGATTALLIMFELNGRAEHKPVEERRKNAAACLGIQPDTFRRANHEGVLILELAMQIYGRLMNGDSSAAARKTPPDR